MANTIRTSLDIPEDLHRRIHEAAQRRGCSARALILSSIERELTFESGPKGRVKVPLVLGDGEPVNPSQDEVYDRLFLDIDVWLALAVERHVLNRPVAAWWDNDQSDAIGFCASRNSGFYVISRMPRR